METDFDHMSRDERLLEVALRIYEARMKSPSQTRFATLSTNERIRATLLDAKALIVAVDAP